MNRFTDALKEDSNSGGLLTLIVLGLLMLVCMSFFTMIGVLAVLPFYGGDFSSITQLSEKNLQPSDRTPLLLMQFLAGDIGAFIAPVVVLSYLLGAAPVGTLKLPRTPMAFFVIGGFALIASLPFQGFIIKQTEQLPLYFIEVAKAKEAGYEGLIKFLILEGSTLETIFAFFVIGIMAGVAEELFFRAMFQNAVLRTVNYNHHFAIWFTALIFGIVHMQWLSLVPRVLLGAMLGYLYYWSGNIWVAVAAHCANNLFSITLYTLFTTSESPDAKKITEMDAPIGLALVSLALAAGIMVYLYRLRNEYPPYTPSSARTDGNNY